MTCLYRQHGLLPLLLIGTVAWEALRMFILHGSSIYIVAKESAEWKIVCISLFKNMSACRSICRILQVHINRKHMCYMSRYMHTPSLRYCIHSSSSVDLVGFSAVIVIFVQSLLYELKM